LLFPFTRELLSPSSLVSPPFRGNGSHHRAIEGEFLLAAKAERFIRSPFSSDPPSMRTERSGQLGAKRLHPVQHCAGGETNIPLGKQPYHLRSGER